MTKQEIDREIFKIEPNIKKYSDEFWGYRFLISAPLLGPFGSTNLEDNVNKFVKFWRTDKKTLIRRGFLNKIWHYGINKTKYLDGEIYSDTLGLALGVNCLTGMMRRCKK